MGRGIPSVTRSAARGGSGFARCSWCSREDGERETPPRREVARRCRRWRGSLESSPTTSRAPKAFPEEKQRSGIFRVAHHRVWSARDHPLSRPDLDSAGGEGVLLKSAEYDPEAGRYRDIGEDRRPGTMKRRRMMTPRIPRMSFCRGSFSAVRPALIRRAASSGIVLQEIRCDRDCRAGE